MPQKGRLILPAQPDYDIPALYLHDLTGTFDAERLLGKTPRIHPSTEDVIPRLRLWAPEYAAKLTEKDKTSRSIPFRLITDHEFWHAEKCNGFAAVSYCWHSEEWNVPNRFSRIHASISCPTSLDMSRAILSFLPANTAIWVDQICIAQDNADE